MLVSHCDNTINDAYRSYYKSHRRVVKVEAQITQDNKVVLCGEDLSRKRLRQLRNTYPKLVTLEEFVQHTPDDMVIMIEIKRFDDKDYVHRVLHFAEHRYTKEIKLKRYIYASKDELFCKQLQCMGRNVLHIHDNFSSLNQEYQQIGVTLKMLLRDSESLYRYSGVYVYDLTYHDYKDVHQRYSWVKGWIIDHDT